MRNTHRERGFRFCICFYDLSASVLAAGEGSLEGSLRVLQTLASAAAGIEGAVRSFLSLVHKKTKTSIYPKACRALGQTTRSVVRQCGLRKGY